MVKSNSSNRDTEIGVQSGKLCYYGTRKQNIATIDRLSKSLWI